MTRLALASVLALLAATAATTATADGAAAQKFSYRFAFLRCSGPTADGGSAALTISTSRGDSIADVFRWGPGKGPDDPPDISNDPEDSIEFAWVENEMSGSTPVYASPGGALLGQARWSLSVVPGEPTPFETRARNGNHLTREEGSTFALAAAGTLPFPDGELVVLNACEGAGGENSVFQNTPARERRGDGRLTGLLRPHRQRWSPVDSRLSTPRRSRCSSTRPTPIPNSTHRFSSARPRTRSSPRTPSRRRFLSSCRPATTPCPPA